MAACEAEYGSGQCTEQSASAVPNSTGAGGSFFVPFLTGYMLFAFGAALILLLWLIAHPA